MFDYCCDEIMGTGFYRVYPDAGLLGPFKTLPWLASRTGLYSYPEGSYLIFVDEDEVVWFVPWVDPDDYLEVSIYCRCEESIIMPYCVWVHESDRSVGCDRMGLVNGYAWPDCVPLDS